MTAVSQRLLEHWRHHQFVGPRPFFCQVEAVETIIWLTEVAPKRAVSKGLLDQIAKANEEANPELFRLAMKMATGSGKTTVMAMLIAWQAVNAARKESKDFSRAFLIVTPGITIKDGSVCWNRANRTTTTKLGRSRRRRCFPRSGALRSSSPTITPFSIARRWR